ncbi:MAG: dTDP-4-amino-4,6-dideoxyglucose formyltransferase [Ferruginibacter sp.]|nr:dTDP-4-amino-4,6-dideoxyglucose formyltransferase [Ferruginibacter sp.]
MVLILSDNELILDRFKKLVHAKSLPPALFSYSFSYNNKAMLAKYEGADWIKPVKINTEVDEIVEKYDLVISLHCKQIFPPELIKKVRCINVHPGLNPYNRGWYPQVFSIINKLPAGATIHEIDEQLDHGPIIAQKPIKIECWDTSYTVYYKVLDAEFHLLDIHLESILNNSYTTVIPHEGNVNLKKDFSQLCQLDLQQEGKLGEHIDLLRALTHGEYANAFFFDRDGNKIYVTISLKKSL